MVLFQTVSRSAVSQLLQLVWNDDRSKALLAISGGWFLSLGVRLTFPVLLPYLRAEYSMGLGTAGLLLTVLWGTYAVGQLPAGFFSDRFSDRLVFVASTAISALMVFLIVSATNLFILFAATGLFGFVTALYGVVRYTAVSAMYPERDGLAIGFTLAVGSAGNVILPAIVGALAASFVWQFGFALTAPLFFIVAGILFVAVPSSSNDKTNEDRVQIQGERFSIISKIVSPTIRPVLVILILSFSLFQVFTGFYPTFLIEEKGLSSPLAAGLFSFYFALGILIQPLSGALYDRGGIRRTLPLFLGITIGGFLTLMFAKSIWSLIGATVLLSGMSSTIAITMPYLLNQLPDDIEGSGLGVVRTVYMLIGATSPTIFGKAADLGYFAEGFYLLVGILAIMILLITRLPSAS